MISRWFFSRHSSVFFAGLLLAYISVLYGIATPHDQSIGKSLVRFCAPWVELGLFYVLCALLYPRARRFRTVRSIGYVAIALIVAMAYTAQIYALYLSGNFITVLALENSEESRIIRNASMYAVFLAACAWWALFCFGYWHSLKAGVAANGLNSLSKRRFLYGMAAMLGLASAGLFSIQRDDGLLQAGFRQSPIIALARTYYVSMQTADEQSSRLAGPESSFATFPLEKQSIYRADLPFPTEGTRTERANVIVIFTEGTSARLIGAYGGRYPGLTPNIDRLASKSMRVINYYNHTAATYRGLQGQLVSGYPAAGGGSDSAIWDTASGRDTLAAIHYQTVPRILRDVNYKTYFISPHYNSVGLNALLRSLGFDQVYSFEDVSRDIAPGNKLYYVEGALSDGDMFHALQLLLSTKRIVTPSHPFLIGMYTFGTHAFLDVIINGVKYGDGSNAALNKLHNYDNELGKFLDYFFASPYAKNTILILTADHANYPDQPYRSVAGAEYQPIFVDRVPLLVYDPTHRLPAVYDADGRTSIDLAPTMLQLLGIQHASNSFMGTSLFEARTSPIGFAAVGADFYATDARGVYPESLVPEKYAQPFAEQKKAVERYYLLEKENRIFTPVH